MLGRRQWLLSAGAALVAPILAARSAMALPALRITAFELVPVRATSRTVWLFLKLFTDRGLIGLGEASDAFGYANTTADNVTTMRSTLAALFRTLENRSPFDVAGFRQGGGPLARTGLIPATAFSALEQAMWDLAGKALDAPTSTFFGGRTRSEIPVYANINRAVTTRTPAGFAAVAVRAVADGFRTIKAAPFDGFPPAGSARAEVEAAIDGGIAAVGAMREAVGPDVGIMIDCHSFFDVDQAVRVASRLEPHRLTWYEEPVAPDRVDETAEIKRRIRQPMAGGEQLYGLAGFAPLVRRRAVDVIMPDVKHCGGLQELTHIAAMAAAEGITVAPHNPSGPVSTAASVQVCAGLENASYLELQYGEVNWRPDVVTPREHFDGGQASIPDRAGLGVELNEAVVKARSLPV